MASFREYNPLKDREALQRIFKEVGWLEEGQEEALDMFIEGSHAVVADIQGEVECCVSTAPGTILYLKEDLPFSCVTGVTTSRIARKQKLAGQLTALAVAQTAHEGALVSGLGMFEQGFYDRLGFGTGSYEHLASFDPAQLRIEVKPQIPSRITKDDWEKVYEARLQRKRGHGACNICIPAIIRGEMSWHKKDFGLGFFKEGEITHHVWFHAEKVEHGPYSISWIAYQTYEQFLELMALIRSLGDQVRMVTMIEPAGIQLQDLLDKPFKSRELTEKSQYENRMRAFAYWQMRILDLEGCMEKTHLSGEEVSFNLVLFDPIKEMVTADAPWQGISGKYVVSLGPFSHAEKGEDRALPTLKASVNAFTRMWLGVRPATGLAVTDNLHGPQELLSALDHVLSIPEPHPDWDF